MAAAFHLLERMKCLSVILLVSFVFLTFSACNSEDPPFYPLHHVGILTNGPNVAEVFCNAAIITNYFATASISCLDKVIENVQVFIHFYTPTCTGMDHRLIMESISEEQVVDAHLFRLTLLIVSENGK